MTSPMKPAPEPAEGTLVKRLRKFAEYDVAEIPDITIDQSLHWIAAARITLLEHALRDVRNNLHAGGLSPNDLIAKIEDALHG